MITLIVIGSNIATYVLTLNHFERENYLLNIRVAIYALKIYDLNNTKAFMSYLTVPINSMFFNANKLGIYGQFAPLCNHIDDELFKILDKYPSPKNKNKISGFEYSSYELWGETEEGKKKMKEFCKLQREL